MKPHRQRTLLVTLLLIGACTRPDERMVASAEPPPAAALAPFEAGTPLDELLVLLEVELSAAAQGEGEETASRLTRAEAISDRLLEATLPFTWLAGESYSLPARLRQIQAGADRILALVRSGAQPDRIRDQTEVLRDEVSALRASLAAGGGPAPPTLDMLLTGRDTTDRYAPEPGE